MFRLPGRAWKNHAVCIVSSNFHENRGPLSLLTDYVVHYIVASLMDKQKVNINFNLCLVCQYVKDDKLVAPVKERASYGESRYSEIWSSLKEFLVEELKAKQGTWHRKCYQDATHSGMLKRAKERHERVLAGPNESRRKTSNLQEAEPINQLTRSKTTPYNKAECFFRDGEECNREKLREVRTVNAGKSLHEAIELSRNDKLRVKFSTAINAPDAHAIDITVSITKIAGLKMFQMYSVSLWHHVHQVPFWQVR